MTEIFFVSLVFSLDYVINLIFQLIAKYAVTEQSIEGVHRLNVNVKGNGSIANTLKQLFKPFKENEHYLNSTTTNLGCLPSPKKLDPSLVIQISLGYSVLLLSLVLDTYFSRIRHKIAGFSFRRQEKRRVVYLYNRMLGRRKNFVEETQKIVERLAVSFHLKRKYSFLRDMCSKYRCVNTVCSWFNIGRETCIVCGEPDEEKAPLIYCEKDNCGIPYCSVCWTEINETCWGCENDKNSSGRISFIENSRRSKYI